MACNKKGFSLIEVIMVIAIVGILAVPGAYVMSYLVQNSIYIPSKLNMDMIAADALDIMIEGDATAKGLRFSKSITAVQDNQITFVNQNNQTVRYRLETVLTPKILYRSINGGAESSIPYYTPSAVTIVGKSNKLFTYYDTNEAVTNVPANVRWISLALVAQVGAGAYAALQGSSDQSSSVCVKKYQ